MNDNSNDDSSYSGYTIEEQDSGEFRAVFRLTYPITTVEYQYDETSGKSVRVPVQRRSAIFDEEALAARVARLKASGQDASMFVAALRALRARHAGVT